MTLADKLNSALYDAGVPSPQETEATRMSGVEVTIKAVPTFTATIYVGFKDRDTGAQLHSNVASAVIREYVDAVGLCVIVTNLEYVYTNGDEGGIAVGLINYPRFPDTPEKIREHAMELARRLKEACRQYKVSVVFPDETVMLSSEKEN